jgi:hypothetical protein
VLVCSHHQVLKINIKALSYSSLILQVDLHLTSTVFSKGFFFKEIKTWIAVLLVFEVRKKEGSRTARNANIFRHLLIVKQLNIHVVVVIVL